MLDKTATLFAPGNFGGAEKMVLEAFLNFKSNLWLIRETRCPQHCNYFIERCNQLGLNFRVFDSNARLDFGLIKDLKKTIKEDRIDLIQAHGLKANILNAFLPVKRIATQHGRTSHSFKMRLMEFLENMAIKRANALICVSRELYITETYKNRFFIENFVLPPNKSPMDTNKHHKRLSVAFFGRLSPEKNVISLIRAIKKSPDLDLHIYGDGPLKETVLSHCKHTQNVYYHGFAKDPMLEMQKYNGIVLPSHREGNPLVIIEASLLGIPVIASRVGGLPEMVKDNGVLFDPQKEGDLEYALKQFQLRLNELTASAQENSSITRQRYSFKQWEKSTLTVYKKLLQKS